MPRYFVYFFSNNHIHIFWRKLQLMTYASKMELHYNGIHLKSQFFPKNIDHIEKSRMRETPTLLTDHCESWEGLWLQGEAASQTHSFRDAEPHPVIPLN